MAAAREHALRAGDNPTRYRAGLRPDRLIRSGGLRSSAAAADTLQSPNAHGAPACGRVVTAARRAGAG